ncbi:MAG: aminotransferase class I/II-fold pyridoxal phosphate-dependent enzyme, partial [Deltaproteobacteria bacterium]|nr:aminotransferase class I/II-fold pyridoxal phosphate-dependent enzyme [Deltaproteobacteria bacterium]
VDEAYAHFADENLLDELPKYKNLVLLRTFSKAFGLGGVRLGYAIGHPEVISEIAKVMLPYCVSGINEAVGLSLLEHPELVEKYVTEIKIERARMYQSMSNFSAMKVYPSQTNFLIFQVADAAKTFQDLLNEKILVRNVSIAQSLPNTLRVSVGTPEENDQFLGALQKVVQK